MVGRVNTGGSGSKCYAFIVVTYPEGSTCTCTSSTSTGRKVLKTKDTTGSWIFKVPFADTWTVSCTLGTQSDSEYVTVSEGQSISVKLSYFPSGYQRVEYLESSGTQYINPSYTMVSGDTVVIEIMKTAKSAACAYGIGNTFYCGTYGSATTTWYTTAGFTYDPSTYAQDTKTVATGTYKTAGIPYFFGTHASSGGVSYYWTGRIYDAVVSNGGTIKHHYVPVYRTSDSAAGLLDIANEDSPTFYPNSGTGTFTCGGNA